jgi:hypothetical protein
MPKNAGGGELPWPALVLLQSRSAIGNRLRYS